MVKATHWEVVWVDGLNVRASPDPEAAVVGELDHGDTVEQLELRDGWIRHRDGWNALQHPEVPELAFLQPVGAAVTESSYEEQRRAMADKEQEMLEAAIKASQDAAPERMSEEGSYQPCDGLMEYFAADAQELAGMGLVRSVGLSSTVRYYYYGCAPTSDKSWGCAYRCCQMLMDCAQRRQGAHPVSVPTIRGIQQGLAQLGTVAPSGKTIRPEDVGSTRWIEPPLVAALLAAGSVAPACPAIQFELQRWSSPGLLDQLQRYLAAHFSESGPRTVVMCDDHTFAYVLAGIREHKCSAGWIWELLLLDPHLCGLEAGSGGLTVEYFEDGRAFSQIRSSSPPKQAGAARWVPLRELMDRNKWMFCVPVLAEEDLELRAWPDSQAVNVSQGVSDATE